jgi:hypothetical protein
MFWGARIHLVRGKSVSLDMRLWVGVEVATAAIDRRPHQLHAVAELACESLCPVQLAGEVRRQEGPPYRRIYEHVELIGPAGEKRTGSRRRPGHRAAGQSPSAKSQAERPRAFVASGSCWPGEVTTCWSRGCPRPRRPFPNPGTRWGGARNVHWMAVGWGRGLSSRFPAELL